MTGIAWLILGLSIGCLLFLGVPTLVIALLQLWRERRELRDLERILTTSGILSGSDFFAVRYRSEARPTSRLSVFPWDAVGILVVGISGIRFYSRFAAWPLLELDLSHAPNVEWRGSSRGLSGGFFWLAFITSTETHLFSADSGLTKIPSGARTRKIFELVRRAGVESND